MARLKYDWPRIKADYINGEISSGGAVSWPTPETLAEKYGGNVHTIRKKITLDNWMQARKENLKNVELQLRETRAKKRAEDIIGLNDSTLTISQTAIEKIKSAIESVDTGDQGLDFIQLESLTRSLERLQKISQISLGIHNKDLSPRPKSGIAEIKEEMMRRRAARDSVSDSGGESTGGD